MLIKTITSVQNEADINGIDNSGAGLQIVTVDEAGRKSKGVAVKF